MATTRLLTAEDLEALGPDYEWYALVEGVLHERGTMGGRHGEIGGQVFWRLGAHVAEHKLGRVYTSDIRFVILHDPYTVHMPDIAFVRAERLPPEEDRVGPMLLAPDLEIDVVSPNDRYEVVTRKIELYQRAGVPLLWLVEPRRKSVPSMSKSSHRIPCPSMTPSTAGTWPLASACRSRRSSASAWYYARRVSAFWLPSPAQTRYH